MAKKIELTKEQNLLFNELKILSKRANQRILELERIIKNKEPLATQYLREKLEVKPLQAWTRKGRVKASKKMTPEQMQATIKATKEFLKNPMSTRRGIKKAKQKAIETLKERFDTDVGGLEEDEVRSLTDIFYDDEVNDITNYIPRLTINGDFRRVRRKRKCNI